MTDPSSAIVAGTETRIVGAPAGRLAGATVVVKDVIDVGGFVTGAGNPTWAATHEPAAANARCVQLLLDAGAVVVGKGTCAEFAYSLSGDNAHYGMPLNPAAPDRNPGGSTSGPAAAVAAGLCDVGLGTDTLGSIRVPASYCGLYGFRPTFGAVSFDGVRPLAPSFDTVGVLAASATMLATVAGVLLDLPPSTASVNGVVALDDVVVDTAAALDAFLTIQGYEVWRVYGDWVTAQQPDFGPGVAERFARAATVTRDEALAAQRVRADVEQRLLRVLEDGAVLELPPVGPAPRRDADADALQAARVSAGRSCCLASIAGLPAVSVPGGAVGGAPVGRQFVAGPGEDRALLRFVAS